MMNCFHCETGLEKKSQGEPTFFICPACGLYHNEKGQVIGYVVAIGECPGGTIPLEELLAATKDEKLTKEIVAQIIYVAAKVGLERPKEVKRRIEEEDGH